MQKLKKYNHKIYMVCTLLNFFENGPLINIKNTRLMNWVYLNNVYIMDLTSKCDQ